jgi:hypothetical protein
MNLAAKPGVHKVSKYLVSPQNFREPEGWRDVSSTLEIFTGKREQILVNIPS